MPVTNANSDLSSIKGLAAEVRAACAEAKTTVAHELASMAREIRENGQLVVKKVQAERAEAMQVFSELLGNERAGDDDSKG